jgi:hypothetical protein
MLDSEILTATTLLGNVASSGGPPVINSAVDWINNHSVLRAPITIPVPKGVPLDIGIKGAFITPVSSNANQSICSDTYTGTQISFTLVRQVFAPANLNSIPIDPFIFEGNPRPSSSPAPYDLPSITAPGPSPQTISNPTPLLGSPALYCGNVNDKRTCPVRDLMMIQIAGSSLIQNIRIKSLDFDYEQFFDLSIGPTQTNYLYLPLGKMFELKYSLTGTGVDVKVILDLGAPPFRLRVNNDPEQTLTLTTSLNGPVLTGNIPANPPSPTLTAIMITNLGFNFR